MACRISWSLAGLACGLFSAGAFAQAPFDRPPPFAGAVIAAKGGEELQFRAEANWRDVVIKQNVLGGDTIRTNAIGAIALLFQDRTQVRVGRNTTLTVKDVARGPNDETLLDMPQGSIFARAARGGSGVIVNTPSAAAAVRGTDWSLAVDGKRTSLVVLEGEVTLSNYKGTVTVRRGEGAEARLGEAPRKIILVDVEGREQFLLYKELRSAFSDLSITNLDTRAARAARARIFAMPEATRTVDDWLLLAESGLAYDGAKAAGRAAAEARRKPLTSRQEVRVTLVEAAIAGDAGRWREAAELYDRAARGVDPSRRSAALYGAWFARSLDAPGKAIPPPKSAGADVTSILARSTAASFIEGQIRALDIVREGLKRFPRDVSLLGAEASLLIELGRRDEARETIERARKIDPDDPSVLTSSASFRSSVQGDLDGALADLERARATAPGSTAILNELAIVQSQRNAMREAEAAYKEAIGLDPNNPALRSNYARFLIDVNRLERAEAQIAEAERLSPGSYPTLAARGRLQLKRGDTEGGLETLLAAAAANPTYGESLIGSAIAAYQTGDEVEAEQALDNADRFDDEDPTTPLIRSAIATDAYRADQALVNAREAFRRRLARGGYYSTLDANRQSGSIVGQALRGLQLNEWGRYYGDRVYDAFSATSYYDQSFAGGVDPFGQSFSLRAPEDVGGGLTGLSTEVQGLLLDPLSAASPERRNTLEYRPFYETAVEGGVIRRDGRAGFSAAATAQGTLMEPVPVSASISASYDRPNSDRPNDRDDLRGVIAFVGAQPTAYDNVLAFQTYVNTKTGARGLDAAPNLIDGATSELSNTGFGWTHTIGERNVVQAMIVGGVAEFAQNSTALFNIGSPNDPVEFGTRIKTRQRDLVGAASHLVGFGDVTLRYGAEGSVGDRRLRFDIIDQATGEVGENPDRGDAHSARGYADAIWDVSRAFKIQGGLYGTRIEETSRVGFLTAVDVNRVDFRLGAAWEPTRGHWLRAAYREDTRMPSEFTLAPQPTVGILPNDLPQSIGDRVRTLALKWDAEWSARFFTTVDYQRQRASAVSVGIPESLSAFSTGKSDIDRLGGAANLWLGHGVGVFASYARQWSETEFPGFDNAPPFRDDVPYLARSVSRVGATWVSPAMLRLTAAQTFVGSRRGQRGTAFGPIYNRLDGFSTTDVQASWELFDRRLVLNAQALNIFDRRFPISPGLAGPGRILQASARVRF
jgi:tetratricopeptide (TPR) repeat protein